MTTRRKAGSRSPATDAGGAINDHLQNWVMAIQGEDTAMSSFDYAGPLSVEWEDSRIRFMAPRDDALKLAERVYLDGGLLWCSRHDTAPSRSEALDLSDLPVHPA